MRNNDASMSTYHEQSPSLEPWLLTCLLALLPGLLIVILPHDRLTPLLAPIIGSMVALLAAGLFMLWRTSRGRRHESSPERHDQREVG